MKKIHEIVNAVRNADYSTSEGRQTVNRIMVQALHMNHISDKSKLDYIRNRLADCRTYCRAKSWELCYDFDKAIETLDKEAKE